MEEDTLHDHSQQSNQTSASTTNAVNTPLTETLGVTIHIAVESGGAEMHVPVTTTTTTTQQQQRPERMERERERRWVSRYNGDSDTGTVRTALHHLHWPAMLPPLPPSSAGGLSTMSYVNPMTLMTACAESSMSQDRTIQAHHHQAQT